MQRDIAAMHTKEVVYIIWNQQRRIKVIKVRILEQKWKAGFCGIEEHVSL